MKSCDTCDPRYYFVQCRAVLRSFNVEWRCGFVGIISVWSEHQHMSGLLCPHCSEMLLAEEITREQAFKKEWWRDKAKKLAGSSE